MKPMNTLHQLRDLDDNAGTTGSRQERQLKTAHLILYTL
jgi:hypothetical protein